MKTLPLSLIVLFCIALCGAVLYIVWPQTAATLSGEGEEVTTEQTQETVIGTEPSIDIPAFLRRSFPNTDFSTADSALTKVLSGGPAKDGIPALDNPTFVPISDFAHADSIQAIVMEDGERVKVYPYNILNWHEIVNDTVNEVPVAVTFCPLCGSAIVYDRQLPTGVTTFGVSGALIESNMVMYDRVSESLWQQSTGVALAGKHRGEQLELAPFQLMTIGEIKATRPDARILSEETGYDRAYDRNPYSGYGEDENKFIFAPSTLDTQFPAKEIMVVFRVGDTPVASPWLGFSDGTKKTALVQGQEITLEKNDKELKITDSAGNVIPFYFEMWFSFAVQHGEVAVVVE